MSAVSRHRAAAIPLVALVVLLATFGRHPGTPVLVLVAIVLGLAVMAAVHHAEVVALRVGEPLGSLILAVAVTVIEVGLIAMLMTSAPEQNAGTARGTVFAAAMIACNGIVGGVLIIGTWRGRVASFNPEGIGSAVAAIGALATLSLVLPNFTVTTPGPYFSDTQLVFAAVASLAIYVAFVVVQNVRHRDFFLPPGTADARDAEGHAARPSNRTTLASLVLLLISLVAVVGLAKTDRPLLEDAVASAGLPQAVVAVAIALLVLLPESLSALKAARRGRIQTGLNLAYGSTMASIGLTIPVIALIALAFDQRLALGLDGADIVLLALTVATSTLTVVPGRATMLTGVVHLAIFAAFLVLAFNP